MSIAKIRAPGNACDVGGGWDIYFHAYWGRAFGNAWHVGGGWDIYYYFGISSVIRSKGVTEDLVSEKI